MGTGWNYIAFSMIERYVGNSNVSSNQNMRNIIYVHNGTSALSTEAATLVLPTGGLDSSSTYSIQICQGGCTGIVGDVFVSDHYLTVPEYDFY